jgi:hypothetical protein
MIELGTTWIVVPAYALNVLMFKFRDQRTIFPLVSLSSSNLHVSWSSKHDPTTIDEHVQSWPPSISALPNKVENDFRTPLLTYSLC